MALAAQKISTKTKTVSVGCKLPSGIVLRVDEMVETPEPVFGGGTRMVKIAQQKGSVKLHGTAVPFGQQRRCRMVGGYAMTDGVDADFIREWLEANKDGELVKNQIIIVHDKDTAGAARELRAVKSGLEPLDVTSKTNGKYTDGRMPSSIKTSTTKTDDEE